MGTYKNYNKGKRYDPTTYTNFTPQTNEKPEALKQQILETKYRLIIVNTIAKRISEDESNLDELVKEVLENPRIKKHYKGWVEKGLDLEDLCKKWYRAYKPELEKRKKGIER